MKKFKDWYKEVSGKEFPNTAIHNGNWFAERGLPIVVSCTCANLPCYYPVHILMMRTIFTAPLVQG